MYSLCHSSNEILVISFFVFVVSVDLGFQLPEKKYFLHRAEHH